MVELYPTKLIYSEQIYKSRKNMKDDAVAGKRSVR